MLLDSFLDFDGLLGLLGLLALKGHLDSLSLRIHLDRTADLLLPLLFGAVRSLAHAHQIRCHLVSDTLDHIQIRSHLIGDALDHISMLNALHRGFPFFQCRYNIKEKGKCHANFSRIFSRDLFFF